MCISSFIRAQLQPRCLVKINTGAIHRMNLMNKSISSQRTQVNFLMVGANTNDPSRGSCLPRSHSVKETKPTLLRKIIVFAASGGSGRKESLTAPEFPAKQSGRNSLFASIRGSFLKLPQSLICSRDQQCSRLLTQPITQDDAQGGVMTFGPFFQNFWPSIMESRTKDGTVADENIASAASNDPPLMVAVYSAVELESTQMDQIAKKMMKLTGCTNLRLENTVDPSVIAGFVISYERDGMHLIDLSVKGQLAELVATIESTDQRIATHSHAGALY